MREKSPEVLTNGHFEGIIGFQAKIFMLEFQPLNPHNANYVPAIYFTFPHNANFVEDQTERRRLCVVRRKKYCVVANAIRTNANFLELSVKNGQFVANAKEENDKICEK